MSKQSILIKKVAMQGKIWSPLFHQFDDRLWGYLWRRLNLELVNQFAVQLENRFKNELGLSNYE